MPKIPKLTPEQRKRLCLALLNSNIYPSMQKAKRALSSDLHCRSVFLQYVPFFTDSTLESIHDISLLYAADDIKLSNCTDNKASNCTDDLNTRLTFFDYPDKQISDISNCTDNKLSNCTDKKVRGKQKQPTMTKYDLRISKFVLQRLGQLDGTVSQHIRQAIDNYLNTKQAN